MTLEEIKASDRAVLSAVDIAAILETDPQSIRVMAHDKPDALGFPVIICGDKGRRVKIPRIQFLRYLGIDV